MSRKVTKFNYAWLIFMSCCFIMAGGMSCCLVTAGLFFAPVCADIGCSIGELSMFLSFYSIGMVIAAPVVGYLLPRVNIRVLMTIMTLFVMLAEGLMSTYTAVWQWWISGAIFGLCGSFIFLIPTPLLIGHWFKKKTGFVLGIAMSCSGIGAVVWSQLFTFFIISFGWRIAYVCVAIVIGVMILPWTIFVLRFRPSDMGLLPYGADASSSAAQGEAAVDGAVATDSSAEGAVGSGKPARPRGLSTKAAVFSIPFVCIAILSGCEEYFGGINSNIPAYALSLGLSATFGATMMSVTQVGNIVIKLAVGWLTDAIGVVKTTYLQMGICCLACLVLAVSRIEWALLAAAFLLGVQNSVVTISEPMLIRYFFGERCYSQIYACIRSFAGILSAALLPVAGYIYTFTGGYELAFILGMAISIVNSALLLLARKHQHKLETKMEG